MAPLYMPKYYHVHRGTKPSTLSKGFCKNQPLFFSKKYSFWYNTEINISREYGGYFIYEIDIPNNMFTVIFATGRAVGWIANWNEMIGGSYRIGRPRQLYTGQATRDFLPLDKR